MKSYWIPMVLVVLWTCPPLFALEAPSEVETETALTSSLGEPTTVQAQDGMLAGANRDLIRLPKSAAMQHRGCWVEIPRANVGMVIEPNG